MKLLLLRKLHKWVAIFVGLQLLLWTTSGLMFAWLDHHQVSGEHVAALPAAPVLSATEALSEPREWIREVTETPVRKVTLQRLGGVWIYEVSHRDGTTLARADDGTPVIVDEAVIRQLALDHYRGTGKLVGVEYHPAATLETRGAGATWQALFDDESETSLYFSGASGSLVATRSDTWRVFDFFWMLHTMDYTGRDNFNNPLVILAGSAALWVALTGAWLVLRVFRWRGALTRRTNAATAAQ